jgi:thymidylate synthase (FAD)
MYWKIDLNNLLKFLSLRIDEHAQFEIRVLANSILELVRPYVPMTIEAWENYILNSVDLTHDVLDMIFKYVQNKSFVLREIENSDKLSRTEKVEIKNKLKKWLF